jgi:HSP20 family protein
MVGTQIENDWNVGFFQNARIAFQTVSNHKNCQKMTNIVKFQPFPATKFFTDGFLDEFFNRNISNFIGNDAVFNQPAVNVVETDDSFKLELAAPGFDKQDFSVNIENDLLTVSATRETKSEETKERYTRREFAVASFKRSFKLPKTVNQDAISAVYENGILSVTLDKKEEAKPVVKTIQIA